MQTYTRRTDLHLSHGQMSQTKLSHNKCLLPTFCVAALWGPTTWIYIKRLRTWFWNILWIFKVATTGPLTILSGVWYNGYRARDCNILLTTYYAITISLYYPIIMRFLYCNECQTSYANEVEVEYYYNIISQRLHYRHMAKDQTCYYYYYFILLWGLFSYFFCV